MPERDRQGARGPALRRVIKDGCICMQRNGTERIPSLAQGKKREVGEQEELIAT